MEIADFIKVYGPLSLGWVIAFYLGKYILDRLDADIKSRTELAVALQSLAQAVKESEK